MKKKINSNSVYRKRVRIDTEAESVLKHIQKINSEKGDKVHLAEIASFTIKKYAKNFEKITKGEKK